MNLRTWLVAAAASALLAGCSAAGSSVTPDAAQEHPSLAQAGAAHGAYAFAPYVDMLAYPAFQFGEGSQQTGTLYYTMAFMVSDGGACEGAWGGIATPSDPTYGAYVKRQLAAIRARGGDGILSFGGAAGKELALVCSDATSLAAAYEADIDAYRVSHVDFDIEGAAVDDLASVERRSQALAAVQAHYAVLGTPISISYTLPVLPNGLPGDVENVVKSALRAGVTIAVVNVMTMDFGDSAPHPQGRMGDYAIEAAQSTARQLRKIGFPLGSNPYASIGVTPMIGINDTVTEHFEPSDAQTLLAWAQRNGLGRIAFWAAQRDKQCPGGVKTSPSDTCSGILQTPGQFSKILSVY